MRAFLREGPGAKGAPWFQYGSNFPAEVGLGTVRSVPNRITLEDMNSRLLTAQEVADRLGVPKTWVYEQSRKGTIPTVTLGHYRRYRAEAIDAWLAQLERSDRRPAA